MGAQVLAQTTLKTDAHTLRPGDQHQFIIAEKAKEGPAGYSQVWDFSDLEKKSEMKSKMLSAGFVKQSNEIPEANVVLEERGTHFFFDVSKHSMKQYGTITKNNTVIKYDKPFVKMFYPFEYGNSRSGDYAGRIISSKRERAFTGNYLIEVDGYGKLKLPGDVVVNDVVRLKTVKKKTYEGSSHTSTIVSYKWYCDQVRYPLLTIIKYQRPDNDHYIKTAYYADAGSIDQTKEEAKASEDALKKASINVFPNPFREQLTLEYQLASKSDVEIIIYDSSGKKVKHINLNNQSAGNYRRNVSTSGDEFAEGMYHINIKAGNSVYKESLMKVN